MSATCSVQTITFLRQHHSGSEYINGSLPFACVEHQGISERSKLCGNEKIKTVKVRMFEEWYEENVMKKVVSKLLLRRNMKYVKSW